MHPWLAMTIAASTDRLQTGVLIAGLVTVALMLFLIGRTRVAAGAPKLGGEWLELLYEEALPQRARREKRP